MDKNDLQALLIGASAEEVDRIHRLLHEWSIGPDSTFPVQLALLTKAQWRIAATLPRLMNESRKSLELHLAQYRQETAALVNNLSAAATNQSEELKKIVATHLKVVNEASVSARNRLWETEEVARRIRTILEAGESDWKQAKAEMESERQKLQAVCNELENRVAWRQLLWFALVFSGVVSSSIVTYFLCRH